MLHVLLVPGGITQLCYSQRKVFLMTAINSTIHKSAALDMCFLEMLWFDTAVACYEQNFHQ